MFAIAATSIVLGVIFGVVFQVDMLNEVAYERFLSESTLFLLSDLVVDFVVLLAVGRFLVKYVPGKEFVFSVGVSVLIIALAFTISTSTNDNVDYPLWYEILSYMALATGISVGVYSKRLT